MGYKRYGSSGSVPTFNDDNNGEPVSNGILKNSSNKEIYFGIKKPKSAADSDKPWRELTTDDFDTLITCETGGCSATITKNDNDTTNKTGIIRYILSKNTTGSARLITFKYNGTELFKINLDADWNLLNKTVTFRFGNSITNIVITWNDSSLPDVEFTIKIKDITNNSTFNITIPKNYLSSGYTTNKTFIPGHLYLLVSCSPTKFGNTTYQVFTGVTSDM